MSTLLPHNTSLLVVDAQCGFTELCPDELPVPGGAAIVPRVNELLALYAWHCRHHEAHVKLGLGT